MGGSGFLSLVENATLLLVLSYLYDLLAQRFDVRRPGMRVLIGLLLGGICIGVMAASWKLANGIMFDTRSVALSVGTLFMGTVPGLIAGVVAAAFRIAQGGDGVVMGVSVIAMSVGVGGAWRRLRRTWVRDVGVRELYLFELLVHVLMLLLVFTLPWRAPLEVLRVIWLPVLVVYPLAGVVLGMLFMDQRHRRRTEEELRASQEGTQAIVASLPHGLVHILDRDFRYVRNEGEGMRQLGLRDEDLVGKTIFEVLPPVTAEMVAEAYERVLEGETVRFEGEFQGEHFMATAAPLRDADGEVRHILALSVIISDRRRAEDEVRRLNAELERRVRERTADLQMANEEMEAFAYSVAHDLRGPLRTVDGFATLIEEDCGDELNDECHDHLQRIRGAVRRMSTLIDGLLRLSQLARADLRMEAVDLSATAADVVADLRLRDPDRDVDVRIASGMVARGDPTMLRLLMTNLIDNAWKFTEGAEQARIEVGSERQDGRTVYFVRDNGAGFDAAYADKLFKPFERLHSHGAFEGTGVGLGIVARVAARHYGLVWAEGRPGKGATFSFSLGDLSGDGGVSGDDAGASKETQG